MEWPVRFPEEMRAGAISMRSCDPADTADLFEGLADERVWEHMSVGAPADVATLNERITSKLGDGNQVTFTVRQHRHAVGITSVVFDPDFPAGVEIGGTLLAPAAWGTGINAQVKRLLLAVCFDHGAAWVQLRTDERNHRSGAAILKLGAAELAGREEHHLRRDGTLRRSRIFRIERPVHEALDRAAGSARVGAGDPQTRTRTGDSTE